MPLAAGTRIGVYEIFESIGAGGMGEVYRARDTRLQRDVAIKSLPELFAADPERLARFRREAQVLASRRRRPEGSTSGPPRPGSIQSTLSRAIATESSPANSSCM